jgi:hypothetical protein
VGCKFQTTFAYLSSNEVKHPDSAEAEQRRQIVMKIDPYGSKDASRDPALRPSIDVRPISESSPRAPFVPRWGIVRGKIVSKILTVPHLILIRRSVLESLALARRLLRQPRVHLGLQPQMLPKKRSSFSNPHLFFMRCLHY